jgi:Ca-activated chloride channel family protein
MKTHPTNLTVIAIVLALAATACGTSSQDSDTIDRYQTEEAVSEEPAEEEAGYTAYAETEEAVEGPAPEAESVAEEAQSSAEYQGTVTADSSYSERLEDSPTDVYAHGYGTNPFVKTTDDNLSTFALDVDTGSYTIARNWIESGQIPHPELIRVEEFVNFFDQGYPAPTSGTFAVYADGAPTPFTTSSRNHIVRIGIKAREVSEAARPDTVLTFVIDVSGSMREGDRIGIVKSALITLVGELRSSDTVAIVAYDRNAWVVLEPTQAWDRDKIISAIDRLEPGGSTNAEAGLTLGYDLAEASYQEGLINRVVLASDGVANVGTTNAGGILRRIEEQASIGINLAAIGVGLGNYNDELLEQLADQGDGFYAYVDSYDEAQRLFVEGLTGTLLTIAEEAKVQVEFNPATVEWYRLIGFENRAIADNEFRNDRVDAGEVGAGHEVTALYEVQLTQSASSLGSAELATVYLRWREPGSSVFSEQPGVLPASVLPGRFEDANERFQVAVVVAAYAEILRYSPWADELNLAWVSSEADRLARVVEDEAVWEFANLVAVAAQLFGDDYPVLNQP